MVEESKFPMVFNKCPICGCPDRICQLAYNEEVKKGRAQESLASDVGRIMTPLNSPSKAILFVNVLVKHYDDCAKCGMRYCIKAEVVQGKIGMIPQQQKGFGFPQGDPKWG